MNLTEFFLKWNGKFNNFDGLFDAQCVDIIKQYFQDVLGLPPHKGNAIDYWQDILGFERISKTPFNRPNPGDIVIWNTKINPYGHIAICNWSRFFDFGGFEQNFPVGSPCLYRDHNYKNVLGWLRPKPVVVAPSVPKIPLNLARVALTGFTMLDPLDFQLTVKLYSSDRISFNTKDYFFDFSVGAGMVTQDDAYHIVDALNLTEKFIFLFYSPNTTSTFYASYYYPKKDCVITTCPYQDPRSLSFELAHQVQIFFNEHRGSAMPVQIVDSNFPTDELIRSKYDSVSQHYQ